VFGGLLSQVCSYLWKNVAPLTPLLKKNTVSLTPIVYQYFKALKYAMFTTRVMGLPNFTKTFVLECHASGKGIGGVLIQDGITIDLTRKQQS
jgi:hypothetical protein